MKEAAINSTPISHPNFKSSISFSVIAGSDVETPGTLTPLWFPTIPLFFTTQLIFAPSIETTSSPTKPSSINMKFPGSLF